MASRRFSQKEKYDVTSPLNFGWFSHRNSRTRMRGLLFSDELDGRHMQRSFCQLLNITVE